MASKDLPVIILYKMEFGFTGAYFAYLSFTIKHLDYSFPHPINIFVCCIVYSIPCVVYGPCINVVSACGMCFQNSTILHCIFIYLSHTDDGICLPDMHILMLIQYILHTTSSDKSKHMYQPRLSLTKVRTELELLSND